MTELTFNRKTALALSLDLIRGHDKNYWCRKGSHWLLKELALDKNGKLFCPSHQAQVSGHTRDASFKHEERMTRY